MPKPFTLAVIQMKVVGGDLERNLDHALKLISAAREGGADVALLPECMDLGWTHPSALEQATSIPDGPVADRLRKAAAELEITVCSGLTEASAGNIYNTAVLIDSRGEILSTHRKIHELEIAHPLYAPGSSLSVAETEFGNIGVMICADGTARDRVLTRSLAYMGADVILSPSSWAVQPSHDNTRTPYGGTWREAYIPVATEFNLHIAGTSNVGRLTAGPWSGWSCIGCSLVVGPDGQTLHQGSYGVEAEEISYVEIHPTSRPARGTGWQRHWETSSCPPASLLPDTSDSQSI